MGMIIMFFILFIPFVSFMFIGQLTLSLSPIYQILVPMGSMVGLYYIFYKFYCLCVRFVEFINKYEIVKKA